jgi:hypothetical protein
MLGRLDEEKTDRQLAAAQVDVMAALRREPVAVELVARGKGGQKQYVEVHPQSFESICLIEARDRELARLVEAHQRLQSLPAKAQVDWGRKVMDEITYQHHCLVWILTTPCPGLKHLDGPARPKIPAAIRALQPHDVVAILHAHRKVNAQRLARVGDLIGGGKGSKRRQSWSVLASSASKELGVHPRSLFRDWTLEEWVGSLSLDADARAQAMDQAKGKKGAA